MNLHNLTIFPLLQTKRLWLRQLHDNDAPLLFSYQSNKKNFPYVDMPIYTDISQAQQYIIEKNEGVEQKKWLIWAIADKNSDQILGTLSLWNFNDQEEKAEFGYGLFPGNTGRGIMREAMARVIKFAFKDLYLKSVEVYTNLQNTKSVSLLDHLHFDYISTVCEDGIDLGIYQLNNLQHHSMGK